MTTSTAAPHDLELVREFVNTKDIEGDTDDLDGPQVLLAWMTERGLVRNGERVTDADLAVAREVREALRSLMAVNGGSPPDPGAQETLNRVAERARFVVQFSPEGRGLLECEASGVDGGLGRILAIVHTAMAEGTWSRLKVCLKDSCKWAFYDHSKNRSRNWCSMAVCGNRVKAETYRRRHQE
ncbi:MAG: CGNR zinc finger domain-containing protein [Actinomycetota bacterium]